MGHRRHAGTRSFRGFYPQLRFLPSRTRPGRLDGDSRGGSCGVDIRAQSPWCAGFHYSGPGLPEPRRRALLAQIGRLDGHVYLVVPSCIRDSAGRPFGESGTLLPWMALVCSRRGSTFFFTTPTIALFVLFPDGGFVPRWARWLILFSIPLSVAMIFQPPAYSWALVGMIVIGAVYAQVYFFFYVTTTTERQQTKWVLFGILLWLLLMGMLSVPYTLELSFPAGRPLPWWTLITSAVWWLALVIVPLSLSIAVLRYRLYDIDVFINRTIVYVSLTLMLGLVYLGSVVTLQYAFRALTGQVEQPQLAIVVSTLVIAALFHPLRRRIQSFIDRRFYRRKYDAAKTLEAFSARLRDETDLEALNGELVAVVRETMQPEHVSLWLRPETASRIRQAN